MRDFFEILASVLWWIVLISWFVAGMINNEIFRYIIIAITIMILIVTNIMNAVRYNKIKKQINSFENEKETITQKAVLHMNKYKPITQEIVLKQSSKYDLFRKISIICSALAIVLLSILAYNYYTVFKGYEYSAKAYEVLNQKYEDVSANLKNLGRDHDALKTKYSEVNGSHERVTTNYKTLNDEKTELSKSYNELDGKYKELSRLYNELAKEQGSTELESKLEIKYFTIGSSENEVKDSMGLPDKITYDTDYDVPGLNITVWNYGTSSITFNRTGQLIRWVNGDTPLNLN